ncbi:M12 family metallopeptidase [Longimicrobium terrae]|uniref:Peptidase M12A domain-containing protein n=1 Tax=Longimicrobium terrae TaxID=1639882 RepID=A0A841GVH7_9BACT|nr:M12 family metallopeptidase [Longimicrobium terrae]MBB4635325.1 hypothetical protein [Longimicrobium terrae]MBB6069718.1 hypothetical protein [Longimicrobium terrae]NNC31071.1 hypothetical protein [Longimicrobium terrae]
MINLVPARKLRMAGAVLVAGVLGACDDSLPSASARPETLPPSGIEARPGTFETRTGFIMYGGRPLEIRYQVQDGNAVLDGDMVLGPAASIAATREELVRRPGPGYGVMVDGTSSRWPSGEVPYVIDPSLTNVSRVTSAMAHIEQKTWGIRFVPRTTQTEYVRIVPATGCLAHVGRRSGMADTVWLATGCSTGNTIHELLHILGMFHEQSRCDRDSYVTVQTANIDTMYVYAFDKHCSGATDYESYDEGSIMHYDPYAFTRNGQPTILSNRGLSALMGQRNGMAGSDINTINGRYIPRAPFISVAYPGGVPEISWAPSDVTQRNVYLIEVERFDYADGSYSSQSSVPWTVNAASGTSYLDTGRSYTGTNVCTYSGSDYEYSRTYYYGVTEIYGSSYSPPSDVPADVAVCS